MIQWLGLKLARWFDRRLGMAKFVRSALNHVFPDHWSFMLGEIALYSFLILVFTGIFLMMFFHDSSTQVVYPGSYRALDGVKMSDAYRSVLHLDFDVRAGNFVRQMHHWAALIFLAAIFVHALRIFFTAAYRKPREINWIIGLTLLLLALGNGYFGYSLPGDLLSGLGMRIGYSILLSVPLIGPWATFILFGSTVPSPAVLPRFYSLHIFFVPAAISALLVLHIGIIWRQYHTNYPGAGRTDRTIVGSRLYPSYTMKSIGLFFLLFALIAALGGLVQIDPVWLYGPFDPIASMPFAQPDWYLGWIEGAMRLIPPFNLHLGSYLVPNVFFSAMLLPTIVFAVLYCYPFIEKLISWDNQPHNVLRTPYLQPFNTGLGCAALMFLLILFFAGGDDVIAVATGSSVVFIRRLLRLMAITVPPLVGIAVYLLCKRAVRKREHPVERPEPELTVIFEKGETIVVEKQLIP